MNLDSFNEINDVLEFCTDNILLAYKILEDCIDFKNLNPDEDLPKELKNKLLIAIPILNCYKLIMSGNR